MDITNGKGVPVVYDSIGKNTFEGSLDSLQNFGNMVTFGNASGPVPPVELNGRDGTGCVAKSHHVAKVLETV